MNKYELLKQNEDVNYQYIKNGILSYNLIRDLEIYEAFNQLEDYIYNTMKYEILAEQYELSSKRIEQIVSSMNIQIT